MATLVHRSSRKPSGSTCRLWDQYLHFWDGILHGNMGVSIYDFPTPVVHLIKDAIPYTLALLVPAIVLSYILGNRLGALAARRKSLDNTVLPLGYVFQASPYPWLALAMAFYLAAYAHWFPVEGGYQETLLPGANWTFMWSAVQHWFLPFFSLFLVGVRRLGDRDAQHDHLRAGIRLRPLPGSSLGAPQRLVRRYAFRNAMLPQITGLVLAARCRHLRAHW